MRPFKSSLIGLQLEEIRKSQDAIRKAQEEFNRGHKPFKDQLENLRKLKGDTK